MGADEDSGRTGAKIRVLLVDDEREFVETLAERLELRGVVVSPAFTAKEALERLEKDEPDVVLLDIRMPGVDGLEALRRIKGARPLVEVILLTGYATVETAVEGMKLGAFDYLMKPAEIDALLEKIQTAHRRKVDHDERIRKAEINHIIKRRGW